MKKELLSLSLLLCLVCAPVLAQKAEPIIDKANINEVQKKLKTQMPGAKIKTIKYDDGGVYIGECNKKVRQGIGAMYFADSSVFVGMWDSDTISGKGKMTYSDGRKYEGDWKNDNPWGKGTLSYSDGSKYEGDWKDGKREGKGTFIDTDGSKYEGEWKDGKREGKGKSNYADGRKYEGEWKDDKREGTGSLTNSDGSKYVGEWKDDVPWGKGIANYADGSKYEGDWKDGKREGKGTFIDTDGSKYEGDWKDGKREGKGTYYTPNGEQYTNEYQNGELINGYGEILSPSYSLKGLIVDSKFYDGEVLENHDGFTFKGKLVEGHPYGKFTGNLSKSSLFHIESILKWDSIIGDEKCGEIMGENRITGCFRKKMSSSYNDPGGEKDGGYVGGLHVVSKREAISGTINTESIVVGTVEEGRLCDTTSVIYNWKEHRIIGYDSNSSYTYNETVFIQAKWENGAIVSGIGRWQGNRDEYFVIEGNKLSFYEDGEQLRLDYSVLQSNLPVGITAMMETIREHGHGQVSYRFDKEREQEQAEEAARIAKIEKRVASLKKSFNRNNAIPISEVKRSRNDLESPYLSKRYVYKLYCKTIERYGEDEDRFYIKGADFSLYTYDKSFAKLRYPCTLYVDASLEELDYVYSDIYGWYWRIQFEEAYLISAN